LGCGSTAEEDPWTTAYDDTGFGFRATSAWTAEPGTGTHRNRTAGCHRAKAST